MKLLNESTVPGIGRAEVMVDDAGYTVIRFWKEGTVGPRPDMLMEMSPAMGAVAETLIAQMATVAGKPSGLEN